MLLINHTYSSNHMLLTIVQGTHSIVLPHYNRNLSRNHKETERRVCTWNSGGMYSTQWNVQYMVCNTIIVQYIEYTKHLHSNVHAVQCTRCTRCTMYTLYNVHAVQCTRCTRCTLYTMYNVMAVNNKVQERLLKY